MVELLVTISDSQCNTTIIDVYHFRQFEFPANTFDRGCQK